jgi:hypothetical protein
MSLQSSSPDLTNNPKQPQAAEVGEDTLYFRRVLRHLVETGDEFIEMARQEATAHADAVKRHGDPQIVPPLAPSPYITEAYVRITRSIRRSIMLAEKIALPKKATAAQHRIAARKQIIRDVEDAIESNAPPNEEEKLHAEFLERLESPDLEGDITNRTIAEIVQDICRDLGVAGLDNGLPSKRRTPHDIATLNARAAANSAKPTPPAPPPSNRTPTPAAAGIDPPAARPP